MSQTPSQSQHHGIPTGIEKLHQADVAATLARDVEGLTVLWDSDGVLLQPGQPAIEGKAAFRNFVDQSFVKSPSPRFCNMCLTSETCKWRAAYSMSGVISIRPSGHPTKISRLRSGQSSSEF